MSWLEERRAGGLGMACLVPEGLASARLCQSVYDALLLEIAAAIGQFGNDL